MFQLILNLERQHIWRKYVLLNVKIRITKLKNVLCSHDKRKFEVHVYATTPADTNDMLYNNMRGVDWRAKVHLSFYVFCIDFSF